MRKGVQNWSEGKVTLDRKDGAKPWRWAFLDGFQVRKNGQPHLDRLRIFQTPLLAVYIHRIHTPDQDRDPHDHPWTFWSFILSGAYTERVWAGKERRRNDLHSMEFRRNRFSLHHMP